MVHSWPQCTFRGTRNCYGESTFQQRALPGSGAASTNQDRPVLVTGPCPWTVTYQVHGSQGEETGSEGGPHHTI
eukprot:2752581-Rhodomonas_salina.1